eukprot:Plantae.Rhodophyta-Palmaria_palmata.ctg22570.p1 GENE.Plantae.Rhodophyta-Palmaria_palmata.ctg22570~~Plantae.Rhodophyta-Palmaria_palmata.ctg22570.p1  ORF type:complete len:168 (-),score=7.76 Plantae.Rhodophyta-Palmaria_palmata.ctg22570:170-613(-)
MGALFTQLFQAVGRGGGSAGDQNRSYEDWLSFIDSQMAGRSNRGATDDEINDLPTETIPVRARESSSRRRSSGAGAGTSGAGSSSSPAGGVAEEEKCPICLGEFEPGTVIKRLPCSHMFCDHCISQWLHINKECPCCKASIRDGTRT